MKAFFYVKNIELKIFIIIFAFFFFSWSVPANAANGVLMTIPYGDKDGQIGGPKQTGKAVETGFRAWTMAPDGIVFVVDNVNKRIVKINVADKKVSTAFSYAGTKADNAVISDIAVDAAGNVYIANSANIVKFSPDGRQSEPMVKTGENLSVKQVRNIFISLSSNLVIFDEHYKSQKFMALEKSGKVAGEVKFDINELTGAYFTDKSGDFYACKFDENNFKVFNLSKKSSEVLNYAKGKDEKGVIFCGHLIGFDAADNLYANIAVSEKDGPVTADYVFKFDKNHKLVKKHLLPMPDEDGLNLAKPHLLLKEDVVLAAEDGGNGYEIFWYDMK